MFARSPKRKMTQRAAGEASLVAPTILMSGYLTKRTRAFLHWKRRWWQLLDNGTLLYFENPDRMKLLGELDITKTCYDVRLGAEHCRVPFPRAVSSGCCFAFSVLKRTYYVYSPTAAEAKRWVESITSVSAILNRRQAAFESSMPPLTSLPSSERKMKPNRRYRAAGTMAEEPRPGPEASARASKHYRVAEAAESQYTSEPEEKPNDLLVFTQKPAHYKRPTHDNSESKSPIQYKRSVPDSKLWLDGSPSPQFGHESSLSQPISTSPPPEPQNPLKYRAHGAMFSSCDHNLHLRGMPLSSSSSESPVFRGGAILPRPVIKRKASDQPLPTAALALHFQRLQHREAVIRRGLAKMEHPRRPTSVDFTTSLPHSYYLPSRLQFSAQTHGRNTAENLARPGRRRSGDRIPPIVKPKPILRSPKGSLPPIRQEDLATATHGSQASAKESDNSVSGNAADLAYLRYHHSRSRSSPGLITMASLIESPDSPTSELPLTFIPPPPLTAPPPSRPPPPSPPDSPPPPKESPDSPISELPLKFMPPPPVTAPPPSRPPPPSPPNSPPPPNVLEFLDPPPPVGPATPQADESSKEPAADWQLRTSERRSPLTKEREANNWALNELRKLILAIKRLGKPVGDKGRTVITFQKLIDGTSGVFEALLATLLAAKTHQIVDFEGDILLKGRDDTVVITLLREL